MKVKGRTWIGLIDTQTDCTHGSHSDEVDAMQPGGQPHQDPARSQYSLKPPDQREALREPPPILLMLP